MQVNPFRRIKDRWSRRRVEKRERTERAPSLSRRAFLFGTGAAIAGNIIGCRTAPLTPEQLVEIEKRNAVRARPPMVTSLRTGNSVKQTLENTPNVRMLETNLRKYKAGEVREANLTRSFDWSTALPLDAETRSIIHTHPTFNAASPVEQKMSQCPSAIDILNLLTKYQHPNVPKKLRFNHIAVVSSEGKVIGYYSMMLGNKLEKTLQSRNIFPSREKIKVTKLMDELLLANKINFEGAPFAAFLRIEATLKKLQKMGLQIRQTPMPGYAFKNGYFQPKLLKKV